jgi:hypothetical protein
MRLFGRAYENNLQHVFKLFSTYFHMLSRIQGGTWNRTTSRPHLKQNSDKTMKQKPLLCPDPKKHSSSSTDSPESQPTSKPIGESASKYKEYLYQQFGESTKGTLTTQKSKIKNKN